MNVVLITFEQLKGFTNLTSIAQHVFVPAANTELHFLLDSVYCIIQKYCERRTTHDMKSKKCKTIKYKPYVC